MGRVKYGASVSLDGFAAGPSQSIENPLGIGGRRLHEWIAVDDARREADAREGKGDPLAERVAKVGALIMGRNMFGGGPGPWPDPEWRGWWGENPPFHLPVFVLTHYPRPTLVMEGDNTFTFVTEGIHAALELAREAAGDRNITVCGGANVAQQYLAAGLLDEIELHVVPILLHEGERLFANLDGCDPKVELISCDGYPEVTHLRYRCVG